MIRSAVDVNSGSTFRTCKHIQPHSCKPRSGMQRQNNAAGVREREWFFAQWHQGR